MPLQTLHATVRAEPMVNRWFATAQLVAPLSFSLHTQRVHVPILKSYVQAPKAHVAALRHPEMLGGPYVDLGGEGVEAIKQLLQQTLERAAPHLGLATDLALLHKRLAEHDPGTSLEPLYEQVPQRLKGVVELVYDSRHQASVRVFEELLRSMGDYATEPLQSVRLEHAVHDVRAFALSTPRVLPSRGLDIEVPFSAPVWDRLFAMRTTPADPRGLIDELAVTQAEPFLALFGEPSSGQTYVRPHETRVTHFGHACVLIESSHGTVLVDPWIPEHCEGGPKRLSFADLPPHIDLVLITHSHTDHFVVESLLALRHRVGKVVVPRAGGCLADASLRGVLVGLGFQDVVELGPLEHLAQGELEVVATPFLGEHGDLDIQSKTGFWIRCGTKTVMCVADANTLEERMYELVCDHLGAVDVLCVGLESRGAPISWVYAPYLYAPLSRQADQSRRLNGCNAKRAAAVARISGCKTALVYALGTEVWTRHVVAADYELNPEVMQEAQRFVADCEARGIVAKMLTAGTRVRV